MPFALYRMAQLLHNDLRRKLFARITCSHTENRTYNSSHRTSRTYAWVDHYCRGRLPVRMRVLRFDVKGNQAHASAKIRLENGFGDQWS
jgi:hypothetical protein